MSKRGVSLVATVGRYRGMDESLAEELKKIPRDAKFELVIAKMTEWAIKDLETRKKNEVTAVSPKLDI